MTLQENEILNKAVVIAKTNGFEIADEFFSDLTVQDQLLKDGNHYMNIIFDHNFAKAFWGEDLIEIGEEENVREIDLVETVKIGNFPIAGLISCKDTLQIPMWQFHLGEMIYHPNPIEYIESALSENK